MHAIGLAGITFQWFLSVLCHTDIVTRAFSESLDKCSAFLEQKGACGLLYFWSHIPKTVCQSEEEQIWNSYTISLFRNWHFLGPNYTGFLLVQKMLKELLLLSFYVLEVFLTCSVSLWNLYFSFWKTLIPPFYLVWIILSQLCGSWLFSIWKILLRHQRFVSWVCHLQNWLNTRCLQKPVCQTHQLKMGGTLNYAYVILTVFHGVFSRILSPFSHILEPGCCFCLLKDACILRSKLMFTCGFLLLLKLVCLWGLI